MNTYISVILLSGGKGTRMSSKTPKQYLILNNKPIALYSFRLFCTMKEIFEIIVVCEKKYQYLFKDENIKIKFASPGVLRQDSVLNGLNLADKKSEYICIHDIARPNILKKEVIDVIESAKTNGAATLGSNVKNTIKKVKNGFIEKTYNRDELFEVYTPQVIKKDLLQKGLKKAKELKATCYDDVSLLELINKKAFIVKSSDKNIKITTPLDLAIAEKLLS